MQDVVEVPAYGKWLLLNRLHPNVSLTPTVEIDRLWHAHMRDKPAYAEDCMRLVGYIPRHNENPAEADQRAGFERLQKLWSEQFGEALHGEPAVCDRCVNG